MAITTAGRAPSGPCAAALLLGSIWCAASPSPAQELPAARPEGQVVPLALLPRPKGVSSMQVCYQPGVCHDMSPTAPEIPVVAGAAPEEVQQAEALFMELDAFDYSQRDAGQPGFPMFQELRYQRLGIHPEDPAAFASRVGQLIADQRAFTRQASAALCARRDELQTITLFEAATTRMKAEIAAWRVDKSREFLASLPPADRRPRSIPDNASVVPLIQNMSIIQISPDIKFQMWRDYGCQGATQ